jgi:uncharacterized protein (DUF2235 family)
MRTFEPDDSIYVFGFSRGAYTARALCGMLHCVGLLTPDNEGLISYAIRMLKTRTLDFPTAEEFKKTFSRDCAIRFVGVWDTVSSVGWVYDAVRFPFTKATSNPHMRIIRHAVSIDERRAFFRQKLFGEPHDPKQDMQEVWFAGGHSDVGGSYAEAESQLSQLALRWMICEAEAAGLEFDPQKRQMSSVASLLMSHQTRSVLTSTSPCTDGGRSQSCGQRLLTGGPLTELGRDRYAPIRAGDAGWHRIPWYTNQLLPDLEIFRRATDLPTYLGRLLSLTTDAQGSPL